MKDKALEIKESVDVLELLLGAEGRKATLEEISRAGDLLMGDVGRCLETAVSFDKEERERIAEEIARALSILQETARSMRGRERSKVISLASSLKVSLDRLKAIGGERDDSARVVKSGSVSPKSRGTSLTEKYRESGEARLFEQPDDMRNAPEPYEMVEITILGKRLREERLKLKLRQKDLAHILGISSAYVSLIENGKCPVPSQDVLRRIRSFLRGEIIDDGKGNENKSLKEENINIQNSLKELSAADTEKAFLLRELLGSALLMEVEDLRILVRTAEVLKRGRSVEDKD